MTSRVAPSTSRDAGASPLLDRFALAGQVAVVASDGSALGCEVSMALADAGAIVAVACPDDRARRSLTAAFAADGPPALVAVVDLTDHAAVDAFAAEVGESLGQPAVAVFVAVRPPPVTFCDQELDAVWEGLEGVCVRFFHFVQRFGAALCEGGQGSIVNVLAPATMRGSLPGAVHIATRGLLAQLTRGLAIELARHGVRVNSLEPTPSAGGDGNGFEVPESIVRRVPQRRLLEPGDVGPAVVFLASEASRFITGASLVIDGGARAKL